MMIGVRFPDNSMPIPISPHVRPTTKPESSKELSTNAVDEEDTPVHQIKEKNNNIHVNEHKNNKKLTGHITSGEFDEKRKNLTTTKRKVAAPNLLGQLNVDKKYLQDLLKCPGNLQMSFYRLSFRGTLISDSGKKNILRSKCSTSLKLAAR